MLQRYEKTSEMQKKKLFFFLFPSAKYLRRSQRYEKNKTTKLWQSHFLFHTNTPRVIKITPEVFLNNAGLFINNARLLQNKAGLFFNNHHLLTNLLPPCCHQKFA